MTDENVTPIESARGHRGNTRYDLDWVEIERIWRTGKLSTKKMGAMFACHPTTIFKRAKKEGWERDLQQAIDQATLIEQAKRLQDKLMSKTSPKQDGKTANSGHITDSITDKGIADLFAHKIADALEAQEKLSNSAMELRNRIYALIEKEINNVTKYIREYVRDYNRANKEREKHQLKVLPALNAHDKHKIRVSIMARIVSLLNDLARVDVAYVNIQRKALRLDREDTLGAGEESYDSIVETLEKHGINADGIKHDTTAA